MSGRVEPDSERLQRVRAEVEAILDYCMCDEGYTDRRLIDPSCSWHAYGEDVAALFAEIARLREALGKEGA